MGGAEGRVAYIGILSSSYLLVPIFADGVFHRHRRYL